MFQHLVQSPIPAAVTELQGVGDTWQGYSIYLRFRATPEFITLLLHSNSLMWDTDSDGMGDAWEVQHGLNPLVNDASAAADGDSLLDGLEVHTHRTSPLRSDSDGDGLTDGNEIALGTLPLRPDTDGDQLPDGDEGLIHNTNPKLADSHGDEMPDKWELDYE